MDCLASDMVDMSTLDYPDRPSAVVFMVGCPLKCPYCSNWNLKPTINDTTTICDRLIKMRRGMDCVTFSGGEPLYQGAAFGVIAKCAQRLGYKIGVQTSGVTGTAPHWVVKGLLNAVMLDIKAVPDRYYYMFGCKPQAVFDTARRLEVMRADDRLERYDTRTVVFQGISNTVDEITEIAWQARGSDTYTIVQGRADLARPGSALEEVQIDRLRILGKTARRVLPKRTRVYIKDHSGKTEIKEGD